MRGKSSHGSSGPFRVLLGVCVVVLLLASSAFGFQIRTPRGVHCPTARVQTVRVPIKDCCGKVVGYQMRAPKAGDQDFLQCGCAEKRSAETNLSLTQRLVLHLATVAEVTAIEVAPVFQASVSRVDRWADHPPAPRVRPPAA